MVTSYDEKGKIFTQVVTKRPVPVVIQTAQNMIRGTMHVRHDSRIKDELNEENQFLAVTEAVVYNLQEQEMYKTDFLVVNRNHIIWVIPEEEISQ